MLYVHTVDLYVVPYNRHVYILLYHNKRTPVPHSNYIHDHLIQDIDSDSVDSINNKVKEWQKRSSYNGNYFEWKSKK